MSTILFLLFYTSCASTPLKPISYVKQPSTEGEIAVAKTLETMITAYNEHDIDKHLSCYATDAKIDSKFAGGFVALVFGSVNATTISLGGELASKFQVTP